MIPWVLYLLKKKPEIRSKASANLEVTQRVRQGKHFGYTQLDITNVLQGMHHCLPYLVLIFDIQYVTANFENIYEFNINEFNTMNSIPIKQPENTLFQKFRLNCLVVAFKPLLPKTLSFVESEWNAKREQFETQLSLFPRMYPRDC